MRVFLMLAVLALWTANGADGSSGLVLCPTSQCTCAAPNEFPGQLVQMKTGTGDTCLCSCGKTAGELCDSSGDCALGTECTAPKDFANHADRTKGVCTDKCESKTCPQYFFCDVEQVTGHALCLHRRFTCSDQVIMNIMGGRSEINKVFTNRCLLENANHDLLEQDAKADLWRVTQ